MNERIAWQERLQSIAAAIDPGAHVGYVFDNGIFRITAPGRVEVYLPENFVADQSDSVVADAIRLRWKM